MNAKSFCTKLYIKGHFAYEQLVSNSLHIKDLSRLTNDCENVEGYAQYCENFEE